MKTFKHLLIDTRSHLRIIQLNRPAKKNAINRQMYGEIVSALSDAANDDNVVITAITGSGDYYSSGNDLSNFNSSQDIDEEIKIASTMLQKFVHTFVEFPKILVGLVNGPAIGIATTTLGLFDVIYASDKATFFTPFSSRGLSVEGGASYTFPKILGPSKANEMLLLDKILTAREAKEYKLVAEVFPHENFPNCILPNLEKLSHLPAKSLMYSKALIRSRESAILKQVIEAECKRLEERWQSEECLNAIVEFMTRNKSKL